MGTVRDYGGTAVPFVGVDTRGIEWFALLECRTSEIRGDLFRYYKELGHATAGDAKYNKIILCAVDELENFVVVFFNGDPLVGYQHFFQVAEARHRDIALVRIGPAEEYPTYDPYDEELLQEAPFNVIAGTAVEQAARRLIKQFTRVFVPGKYHDDTLKRIVHMCTLGEDRLNRGELCELYLYQWTPRLYRGENVVIHWESAMEHCISSDGVQRQSLYGCNIMARVMAHIVYLEEINPMSASEKRSIAKQHVKRMSFD